MRLTLIAATIALVMPLFARAASAECAHECVEEYRFDVNFCQTITGNDPLDDDHSCFRNARDDYRACVDDCSDPLGLTLR
ncbi:MAG TPA: hypothetical protein VHY56_05650 [Candidatus Binataceae bacterium]|jgi:hypothetical protein|nr:hypothetical protein [Candidatus Binataceae bacterium]